MILLCRRWCSPLVCWLSRRCSLRARARATLDRDRRRRGCRDPDRDRPVRQRGHVAARHLGHRRRRSRALAACSGSSTRTASCRGPSAPRTCRPAVWRARNADAVVVGSMQPLADGRVDVRFALVDVVKQSTLVSMQLHRHAAAVPRHGAQDRRHHLREAHRRPWRVLDAHRVHHQAGAALPAARRRRRRRRSAGRSSRRTSRCCRPRWSPDGSRLAYVSFENKKPVVYVQSLDTGAAPGGRELPRQQLVAGVVAGRPPARRHADQGRRLADLHDERRRQQRHARADVARHRHRGDVHARRPVAAVHVRSRRHAADLPRAASDAAQVERLTFDGSYNVSPRPAARRQGLRVRASRRRPFPDRDPWTTRRGRCRC